jgi:hypothetical protein
MHAVVPEFRRSSREISRSALIFRQVSTAAGLDHDK